MVVCVSSCDFLAKEDVPSDDPSLITAAKTFLVVDRPNLTSAAWSAQGDGFDPGVLKARRPPEWSTARVLRGPGGTRFVVVRLGGSALAPAGDGIVSTGMMVFDVAGQGFVRSGKILELLTPEAGATATLA